MKAIASLVFAPLTLAGVVANHQHMAGMAMDSDARSMVANHHHMPDMAMDSDARPAVENPQQMADMAMDSDARPAVENPQHMADMAMDPDARPAVENPQHMADMAMDPDATSAVENRRHMMGMTIDPPAVENHHHMRGMAMDSPAVENHHHMMGMTMDSPAVENPHHMKGMAMDSPAVENPHHMAGMVMDSDARSVATNSSGSCGVGYTYCGYILKEQKHFDESTILEAYCQSGLCESGGTSTDPLQGLYVCLPDSAIPKRPKRDGTDPLGDAYVGPVKIELLCACNGKPYAGGEDVCLNPDGDHIGRCSASCQNVPSA